MDNYEQAQFLVAVPEKKTQNKTKYKMNDERRLPDIGLYADGV